MIVNHFVDAQPEDVTDQQRFLHATVQSKSTWERFQRIIRRLQTGYFLEAITKPDEIRPHYKAQETCTQTEFQGGHFPHDVNDMTTWPYYGEKYPRMGLTIGAPV